MTGAVAASLPVRFVAGLRFPFRTAGGGRPVRRIFRLPAPQRQGEAAGAGAVMRSASPLRSEGEACGEGERGGQVGGFVHGPAVDAVFPLEFSVVYHDAETEMEGPAFSQAERHARFRTAVEPGGYPDVMGTEPV